MATRSAITVNPEHSKALPIHQRSSQLRLLLSMFLTSAFVILEALAGYRANSLALLTDALHNLTDVVALAVSWYATRLAQLPPNSSKTFGYHRVGILAALTNSSTLGVIGCVVIYEAYHRYLEPPAVQADILVVVGAAAFVVNLVTAWLVSHGREHDLNLRSAFLHLLGDVFSTLGAVVAGVGIWLTGLNWLDPLASFLIGLLILWNAWTIISETIEILLEGAPRDIDMTLIVRDMLRVPAVRGVHDLHVWSLSRSLHLLSAHVLVDDMAISEGAEVLAVIKDVVNRRYGISHTTLELECVGCDPDALYCSVVHSHKAEAEPEHHH